MCFENVIPNAVLIKPMHTTQVSSDTNMFLNPWTSATLLCLKYSKNILGTPASCSWQLRVVHKPLGLNFPLPFSADESTFEAGIQQAQMPHLGFQVLSSRIRSWPLLCATLDSLPKT